MIRQRVEAALGTWRRRRGLLLPVILLISLGCGKPTGEGDISGKVTYEDKPLSGGSIVFLDDEDRQVGTATLGLEGEYSVFKVPVGLVRITVSPPSAPPHRRQGGVAPSKVRARPKKPSVVTYTVQPGKQEHNIDLYSSR
jgi:hypothetical protein